MVPICLDVAVGRTAHVVIGCERKPATGRPKGHVPRRKAKCEADN